MVSAAVGASATRFLDAADVHGLPSSVDVLIVGSGPAGSAYARRISEIAPRTRILMVEAGPRLTERPGVHMRNIADEGERERARRRSEGRATTEEHRPRVPLRDYAVMNSADGGPQPMPGVFFVDPNGARETHGDLYAAAMSCNVGGMGSHWAGATPHPRGRERIGFIPADQWEDALTEGRRLLAVSTQPTADTAAWQQCLSVLGAAFDDLLPADGKVQNMPVARRPGGGVSPAYWTGPDVILGELAEDGRETFAIAAETLCRELIVDGTRVAGAVLEHLPSATGHRVFATAVVVCGDSLRTPQLLWASGIRPTALGHYLNDHTTVGAFAVPDYLDAPDDPMDFMTRMFQQGHTAGVGWLPYSDDAHPIHGQLGQIEVPQPDGRNSGIVAFGYFLPKDIRFEDCVRFRDDVSDAYGMPALQFDYGLTERDRESIELARVMTDRAIGALDGSSHAQARQSPPGSSLHYMGTVRMGEHDDSRSVCDSYSQVWGFDNLFVGGNGVIPTATACNPTLTNVALACRAATRVVSRIR